jgi:PhzF family phenazine biosynthesis protein
MPGKTKPIEVLKVFAFTSPEGGGNPAGVVLDADELSPEEMQEIAAKAGFSETAFVSKSDSAGFRLDFFTPTKRIPDCGHATVAAFSVIKERHPELTETSKKIETGIRKILIEGTKVFMEQPFPSNHPVKNPGALFPLLFESSQGLVAGWIVRHDVGFAIFEIDGEARLGDMRPNLPAIQKYSDENDLVGIYLFVRKTGGPIAATTRMFAPAYGIPEESATGMAAGLLAPLLKTTGQRFELTIEQGRHMVPPSPSLIFCKVRPDENRVLVGGTGFHDRSSFGKIG